MPLCIFDIPQDKEQWVTIPVVIYSSIRTLNQSCGNVRRWADEQEHVVKKLTKEKQELEARVAALEERGRQHDKRFAFLFLYSSNLYARQWQRHNDLRDEVQHTYEV